MGWTRNGYRYSLCIACQVALGMRIRNKVKTGHCYIYGIGDLCGYHFHMLRSALKDGGASA